MDKEKSQLREQFLPNKRNRKLKILQDKHKSLQTKDKPLKNNQKVKLANKKSVLDDIAFSEKTPPDNSKSVLGKVLIQTSRAAVANQLAVTKKRKLPCLTGAEIEPDETIEPTPKAVYRSQQDRQAQPGRAARKRSNTSSMNFTAAAESTVESAGESKLGSDVLQVQTVVIPAANDADAQLRELLPASLAAAQALSTCECLIRLERVVAFSVQCCDNLEARFMLAWALRFYFYFLLCLI